MSPDEIGNLLAELAETDFEDEGSALTGVAIAVAAINEELRAIPDDTEGFAAGKGKGNRIREWLKRLKELVVRIATQFGAISYSISVGFPAGVSVDFSWKGPKSG